MTERNDPSVINRLLKDITSVRHLSSRWPWNDLTTLANEILALRVDSARLDWLLARIHAGDDAVTFDTREAIDLAMSEEKEPDEADYPGKYRGHR